MFHYCTLTGCLFVNVLSQWEQLNGCSAWERYFNKVFHSGGQHALKGSLFEKFLSQWEQLNCCSAWQGVLLWLSFFTLRGCLFERYFNKVFHSGGQHVALSKGLYSKHSCHNEYSWMFVQCDKVFHIGDYHVSLSRVPIWEILVTTGTASNSISSCQDVSPLHSHRVSICECFVTMGDTEWLFSVTRYFILVVNIRAAENFQVSKAQTPFIFFHSLDMMLVIMLPFTRANPYSCSYCDHKCNQSTYLKRHERIHIRHNPYSCSDYDNNQSTRLERLERIHIWDNPYSCSYCDSKCNE